MNSRTEKIVQLALQYQQCSTIPKTIEFKQMENSVSGEISSSFTNAVCSSAQACVDNSFNFDSVFEKLCSPDSLSEILNDEEKNLPPHSETNVEYHILQNIESQEQLVNNVNEESLQDTSEEDDTDKDKTWVPNHTNLSSDSDREMEVKLIHEEDDTKKKKKSRWKRAAPETWSKNVSKKNRRECKAYKTQKGLHKAKSPQPVNCNACRCKCTEVFSDEDRTLICSEYWKLDYCRQKDFILKNVLQIEPCRRRVRTENGKNRSSARLYYFYKNSVKHRVCQKFFTKTLNISDGPIIHAFKNTSEIGSFKKDDQRGKRPPVNKTPEEEINRVTEHIKKFPVMESHYCRKSSSRLYLDCSLCISKMYELYKNESDEHNVKPVSSITYRRIFCTQFNYSFFHPKKDQCLTCTKFNSATGEDKQKLSEEYEKHRKRAEDIQNLKQSDKERSHSDAGFLSATFDLQSVLQIPSAETSQLYYSRKLCVYNLCVYESKLPNKGYCISWSELNGKSGSTEIGSALLWWFQQVPENVKEISLFSDSCGGQNRNQHIAALFLHVIQTTHLEIIEHMFMEKGHSYMEVDSMHSAIENRKKNVEVFSMIDWLNIYRFARSSRKRKDAPPYQVKELIFSDMIDMKDLSAQLIKNRNKDENGSTVSWLKVKCLKYEKNLRNIIQYRYDYSGPYTKIYTCHAQGRPVSNPIKIKNAYHKTLPISKEKKKDLERLCQLGIIPTELQVWYKSLPTSKFSGNKAPQPGPNSEDDSESDCENNNYTN